MAKDLTVIEIDLKNHIDVDADGDNISCSQVQMTAPSTKHMGQASVIKHFCGNIMDKQMDKNRKRNKDKGSKKKEDSKSKKDDRFTGETLNQIIAMTPLDDPDELGRMYNLFRIMLCDGCGKIGGVSFTRYLFEELSFKDMENLFGEYVVTFLLDSLVN